MGLDSTSDVFKPNRLLPNIDIEDENEDENIDIPESGVVVIVLEQHLSCGMILYVRLIPGIFLPFSGL